MVLSRYILGETGIFRIGNISVSGGWAFNSPLLFSNNRKVGTRTISSYRDRTKNIKIAPPVGRAAASKRILFSLFEPFNSLFFEGGEFKKCQKNQNKIQIQKCGPVLSEAEGRPFRERWRGGGIRQSNHH